jgi:hypothetical protein
MMKFKGILPLAMLVLLLQAGERYIHIAFPDGGEVLKGGSKVTILWSSLGVEGDVAILLFKGGEQYAVIADRVPNSGNFQWDIPTALPDSGRYRLRICSLRDLRINDFSDRDFAIKK